MKIKNIFKYLLALPVLLSTTACSDWLEVKPQNVITIDEFWNEKADVDGMIAGLYTTFESQNVVERMMVWGEFRSDNISTGANITKNPSLENVFRENINASNGYTTGTSSIISSTRQTRSLTRLLLWQRKILRSVRAS